MLNETLKLNAPELRPLRRLLLGLLVVNFLIYAAVLIPLSLNADPISAVISVAIIAGYYILEGSLFFGCETYNWPCTLTFRIIWVLHDFAYFITYANASAWYKGKYLDYDKPIEDWEEYCKDQYSYVCEYYDNLEEFCDNDPNDWRCKDQCIGGPSYNFCYNYFAFDVACTFFFLLAFGLGIGIIFAFSKLPRFGCCCQTTQNPIVVVNGQTYQMQTIQRMPNGQLVMIQKSECGHL